MDDETLERLLHAVDEPGPEPTEFKASLRAELQTTLDRPVTGARETDTLRAGPQGRSGWEIEDDEHDGSRGLVLPLTIAASLLVVVIGLAVLIADGTGDAPTATVPSTNQPIATTQPSMTVPTIETACTAYVSSAASLSELDQLAAELDGNGASTLDGTDLLATATALDDLRSDLQRAGAVDAGNSLALELAAGRLRQAATQQDGGEPAAAAVSLRSAVDELRLLSDPPNPLVLPACGFP